LLIGRKNDKTTTENILRPFQTPKNRIAIKSSNSTPRYIPKGIKSRISNRHMYKMFIIAGFTIIPK
jgi:hypothetical protein